jgi:predicted nuclease of predicted toxin-antitoxin system
VRFLLDVCVASRSLQARLAALGHEVRTATDIDPRASDSEILEAARAAGAILVTEDKDFGELIHVRRQPHGVVVRRVGLSVDAQIAALGDLILKHPREFSGSTPITVTRERMRFRRL